MSKPKQFTRLATTVAAFYDRSIPDAAGFFLDGRISGPREDLYADITLEREDFSFFNAIFASNTDSGNLKKFMSFRRGRLDRFFDQIKTEQDFETYSLINDMADCATCVPGRMTFEGSAVQPYFAGMMIRNAELTAVTTGRALAFIYRDNTLFPLTQKDILPKEVNASGKRVTGFRRFVAAATGTIYYSHIIGLQPEDAIILCNTELLEQVGQEHFLQILKNADDQCSAAGMLLELAAKVNPNVPCQCLISFVDDLLLDTPSIMSMRKLPSFANEEKVFDATGRMSQADLSRLALSDEDEEETSFQPRKGRIAKFFAGLFILLLLVAITFIVYAMTIGRDYNLLSFLDFTGQSTTVTESLTEPLESTVPTTRLTLESTTVETIKDTPTPTPSPVPEVKLPDSYVIKEGQSLYQIIDDIFKDYVLTDAQQEALVKEMVKDNPDVFTNNGDNYQAGAKITVIPELPEGVKLKSSNSNTNSTEAGETTATTATETQPSETTTQG